MSTISTKAMNNSTILRVNAEKNIINSSPDYQRKGDIWDLEKKQLLIDSILNDYDIPKLYFHEIPDSWKSVDNNFTYAIIDGRQRLEAIWGYINGTFALDKTFKYYKDPNVKAGGLTYSDLGKKYPMLKIYFDSFVLPIILVSTDDLDLIEDMFSRLNEAVPLNAAEKRNAFGGPIIKKAREVADLYFFKQKVKFSNKRYQHREVATKLLFLEFSLTINKRIIDMKKYFLDSFAKDFKQKKYPQELAGEIGQKVQLILRYMEEIFINKDELLSSQAIIPIYYLYFREMLENDSVENITRSDFLKFRNTGVENRRIAAENFSEANYDLLIYDKMSVQGTNDATSIKERYRIFEEQLNIIRQEGQNYSA